MVTLESVCEALRAGPHDRAELSHGSIPRWTFGEGPDVVFLHGWPVHAATWRRVAALVARRYRVHLLDMPGVGQAGDWTGPLGIVPNAAAIGEALDTFGLERFALVSHDSGGAIARILTADRPEQVQALILGNTEIPGRPFPELAVGKALVALPGFAFLTRQVTRLKGWQRSRFGFGGAFGDPDFVEGDFGAWFVRPLQQDPEHLAAQMRFVRELDWDFIMHGLAETHTRIEAPVLLIWGADDPWFPWSHAQEMVPTFGGGPASVELIPGGKLFVHEEFADRFAERALAHLDAHL